MDKQHYQQNVQRLHNLIKDIDVTMLTTLDEDGTLRSRPMATPKRVFDGTIWFFTEAKSPKVQEVQGYRQVNLSYADPERDRYVSLSGKGYLVHDQDKIHELWNSRFEKWLKGGVDNPNLALLRIDVLKAEIWDPEEKAYGTVIDFLMEETGEK
jgi:general stress protein 26